MSNAAVKTYDQLVAIPDVLPVRYHPNTWHCVRHGEFKSRQVRPACVACVAAEVTK